MDDELVALAGVSDGSLLITPGYAGLTYNDLLEASCFPFPFDMFFSLLFKPSLIISVTYNATTWVT